VNSEYDPHPERCLQRVYSHRRRRPAEEFVRWFRTGIKMKAPLAYLFCRVLQAGASLPQFGVSVVKRLRSSPQGQHAAHSEPSAPSPPSAEKQQTGTPVKFTERRIYYFLFSLNKMASSSLDFLRITPYAISLGELFRSVALNVRAHLTTPRRAQFTVDGQRGDLRLVHRRADLAEGLLQVGVDGWSSPVSVRPGTSDVGVLSQVVCTRMFDSLMSLRRTGLDPSSELCIVDGGANVGYSSIWFHHMFPRARIIALEPQSGNFDLLSRNCAPFRAIEPLEKGLWSRSSPLVVLPAEKGEEWGTQVVEYNGENWDVDGISVLDLKAQCRLPTIDLFKIDIEGSELQLFGDPDVHQWLDGVKILCIELHGKACNEVVFGALAKHDVSRVWFQDDLMFIRLA
jgi:FkbM family methyltransferase